LAAAEPLTSITDDEILSGEEQEQTRSIQSDNLKNLAVDEFIGMYDKQDDIRLLESAVPWNDRHRALCMRLGAAFGRAGNNEEARRWFLRAWM